MATTYARIKVALRQAERQAWSDLDVLSHEIRSRKLRAFRMRGDGSSIDNHMSEASITNILRLMIDLELLETRADSTISISLRGKRCLSSDDTFDQLIVSSINSLLDSKRLPMSTVMDVIEAIKLPNVPDAATIYSDLPKSEREASGITEMEFRRLLFLYANAKGIDRKQRVHYVT